MKRLAYVCLVLIVASGCGADVPPAESSAMEDTDEFWSHRLSITDDVAYGGDPAQRLDVYVQGSWIGEPNYFELAPDPRPTLLHIHGGGWVGGDKAGAGPLFLPFVERGWNVASMTYRLGPGTAPAAVDDAVCALKWVVDNASDYGFDPNRVVVSGESAGGHLALTTGILGSREGHRCYPGDGFRVGAVINWFGITDIAEVEAYLAEAMPDQNYARAWAGDVSRIPELSERYSPLEIVDEGVPPVLTIHGEDDSIVPHDQAVTFHARLTELGASHRLLSLPGGTHVGFTDAQFQEAFRTIFAFLEELGLRR